MVSKVQTKTVYKCEVCNKTHATLKAAEKCESSHEETRLKQEQEAKERMKLHDALVDIRLTSESFVEIQQRALVVLKEHYGDDFVLELKLSNLWHGYGNAVCTYMLSKKVKSSDYYNYLGESKEIDASRVLRTLGFITGCGNGNGKTYSYQCNYNIDNFPAIQAKMLERENAVCACERQMKQAANWKRIIMAKTQEYNNYKNRERNLKMQIDELQDKLETLLTEKQQYIQGNFYKQYEAECCDMIAALPQQFKEQFKDPVPLGYFSFD